ncbi:hypothetical protein [Methylobacterium sp. Leaf85]|uniref:hypothetical protein n=1 Tax=Methylobacterium sp. Leaf85 TaxID=1736241 RepID=UPI0012E8E877|nr:hypothetical protein [Methylobacterium sp. Leaf85]
MRYHRKATEPVVVGRTKASLPIEDKSDDMLTPLQASLITVERMIAAGQSRRKAELKKSQNA